MERITGAFQRYAWGSCTAIPDFLGVAATGQPAAELWFGAHPLGATVFADGTTLAERIAQDPEELLGLDIAESFGELPFLLKLIAPAHPLSLQVHPSRERAQLRFAQEEATGMNLDDPRRSYKDPNHKPEMVMALTRFEALSGLRTPRRAAEMLTGLEGALAHRMRSLLRTRRGYRGTEAVVTDLLRSATTPTPEDLEILAAACARRLAAGQSPSARIDRVVGELARTHPGDPGIALALLLNPVTLEPGQVLFVPAGTLHAYLWGLGVEVMASSDNVLRACLTEKHTDIGEVLAAVDYVAAPPVRLAPENSGHRTARFYAPVEDFELAHVAGGIVPEDVRGRGPRLLLCLSEEVTVTCAGAQLCLRQGQAAFVSAQEPNIGITGPGALIQVAVP